MTDAVTGCFAWLAAGALPMAVAALAAVAVERLAGPRLWPGAREALWGATLVVPWLPSPIATTVSEVVDGGVAESWWSAGPWAALWVVGIAVLLARLLGARTALRARILADTRPASADLAARVDAFGSRLGLVGAPAVRVCGESRLGVPLVVGVLRPTLVLPPRVDDCALVHELVHVARRDPLRAIVAAVLAALVWWHPAAWLARRRLAVARELGCDARSVATLDGDLPRYRRALADAARRALGDRDGPLGVTGFVSLGSALRERLAALRGGPSRCRRELQVALAWLIATVLGAGAACVGERPAPLPIRPLPPVLAVDVPASAGGPGCLPLRFAVLQAIGRERFASSSPNAAEETP